MELNVWTRKFKEIHTSALARYQEGKRNPADIVTAEEKTFLASIGLQPITVFDYAEDFNGCGEPDWETALLMVAARRDFFLYEQKGKQAEEVIGNEDLPARNAELGGIRWLPRIIVKARCFLRGGLTEDIMYCCGGDRGFLKQFAIHPADFLRIVWAAEGDEEKVLKHFL